MDRQWRLVPVLPNWSCWAVMVATAGKAGQGCETAVVGSRTGTVDVPKARDAVNCVKLKRLQINDLNNTFNKFLGQRPLSRQLNLQGISIFAYRYTTKLNTVSAWRNIRLFLYYYWVAVLWSRHFFCGSGSGRPRSRCRLRLQAKKGGCSSWLLKFVISVQKN